MPAAALPPLYLKLIRRFPLRPIRSDADLERAARIAEELDFRDDLAPEERDYLDVLVALIERHEDERHPIADVSGPAALRSLIEFRQVSQAEVSRATGIAGSILSELLRGKRTMGRKTIEVLARYFHVDPGVFLAVGSDGESRS